MTTSRATNYLCIVRDMCFYAYESGKRPKLGHTIVTTDTSPARKSGRCYGSSRGTRLSRCIIHNIVYCVYIPYLYIVYNVVTYARSVCVCV